VLVVVLALVATPFVTSVAQHVREIKPAKGAPQATGSLDNPGLGHDAAHCAMRAALHPGETINKCPDPVTDPGTPPPPPQPPPSTTGACGSAPAGGGSVTIDGQVYSDASPWPGLAGWCVELSGPVSATAVTDAFGAYLFLGLPKGTYTVCETVQPGWHQTFPTSGPTCATGFGWTTTLLEGRGNSYIDFWNLTP